MHALAVWQGNYIISMRACCIICESHKTNGIIPLPDIEEAKVTLTFVFSRAGHYEMLAGQHEF